MADEKKPVSEIPEKFTETLMWQTAERDDKAVAHAVHGGQDLDGIYGLNETGLLDDFFDFLEQIGAMNELKAITPTGVRRVMVSFTQFVLLYVCRVLLTVPSMHALPSLLFSNVAAMNLVGFNAHQVRNGVCRRGRKGKRPETGPICDDTLSRNIVKIAPEVLARFFNGVVRCLAVFGLFPKRIWVILDGSDLPTTQRYAGCGSVTRKKRIKDKFGRWQTVEVTVFGFKLLAVFYGPLRIPLAARVVPIQEPEGKYFLDMLDQAQNNLRAGGVEIAGAVADRAYLDGEDLWKIHKRGIYFVVPAKSGMTVSVDARSLAASNLKCQRYEARRIQKLTRGIGRKAHVVEVETRLVGITGLTTYAQYGEPGCAKEALKKNGRSNPINAVVVRAWGGKEYGSKGGPAYLTNLPVNKPFLAFDRYDERSVIENGLFKEGKGPWKLRRFPQKNALAVQVHVLFVLAVMALTNAYRTVRKREEAQQQKQLKEDTWLGMEQYRRELRRKSKDQGIVFVGEAYGIFYLSELFVLMGRKVKDLPAGIEKAEDILSKYGIAPQAP